MALEVDFVTGTIVSANFLNDQQQVKSALHFGVRLERASPTQIQLTPLDDGNDAVTGQSSIIVDGKPRWWNSAIVKTVSGAKGTYSIYVTAGESTTLTAANLTLTTEAAPANSRKIGEVDWSGSAIERIRQNGMGDVTGAMIDDEALSGAGDIEWTRRPGGALVPTLKGRFIRGQVEENGESYGSGFTAERLKTGEYKISYDTPLSTIRPATLITVYSPVVPIIATTSIQVGHEVEYMLVHLWSAAGSPVNKQFSLLVIER